MISEEQEQEHIKSSLNTFLEWNSNQKIIKIQSTNNIIDLSKHSNDKFFIIRTNLSVQVLLTQIKQLSASNFPYISLSEWGKLQIEIQRILQQKVCKNINPANTGRLIQLSQGQGISLSIDYYNLPSKKFLTTLICLTEMRISSGSLAFLNLPRFQLIYQLIKQQNEYQWNYADLQPGDIIVMSTNSIYCTFRNDTQKIRYYSQFRWVSSNDNLWE